MNREPSTENRASFVALPTAVEWSHAILTHACDKASIERAALALSAATGSTTRMFRGLARFE